MTSAQGLTLLFSDPLVRGGTPVYDCNVLLDELDAERAAYGGYWSLSHRFNCTQRVAESWLEEGIGRHAELYAPTTSKVGEFFVDEIEANIGSLTVTRGPLLETVANRILVAYSTVDTATDPPTVGIRDQTAWADDATSQGKYGIIERVISVGGATPAEALQIRDTAIIDYAEPGRTETDNLQSSEEPSVTLTCLGYFHWLKAYTVDLTTTGMQNADLKVQAVLAADPNGVFSTDYSYLDSNTVQAHAYDRDLRPADTVIKGIVAMGGPANERWLFGFGPDRVAYYNAIPDEPLYQRRLAEPEQRVEMWTTGQRVMPWSVDAGEWVFYTDLLASRSTPDLAQMPTDPRFMFVERATYTLPWALTMQGSLVGNLDQMLARLGLGGTHA